MATEENTTPTDEQAAANPELEADNTELEANGDKTTDVDGEETTGESTDDLKTEGGEEEGDDVGDIVDLGDGVEVPLAELIEKAQSFDAQTDKEKDRQKGFSQKTLAIAQERAQVAEKLTLLDQALGNKANSIGTVQQLRERLDAGDIDHEEFVKSKDQLDQIEDDRHVLEQEQSNIIAANYQTNIETLKQDFPEIATEQMGKDVISLLDGMGIKEPRDVAVFFNPELYSVIADAVQFRQQKKGTEKAKVTAKKAPAFIKPGARKASVSDLEADMKKLNTIRSKPEHQKTAADKAFLVQTLRKLDAKAKTTK